MIVWLSSWPHRCLNVPGISITDIVQAKEHKPNIEDQVNDPMEEDDSNNIDQDDGTN